MRSLLILQRQHRQRESQPPRGDCRRLHAANESSDVHSSSSSSSSSRKNMRTASTIHYMAHLWGITPPQTPHVFVHIRQYKPTNTHRQLTGLVVLIAYTFLVLLQRPRWTIPNAPCPSTTVSSNRCRAWVIPFAANSLLHAHAPPRVVCIM